MSITLLDNRQDIFYDVTVTGLGNAVNNSFKGVVLTEKARQYPGKRNKTSAMVYWALRRTEHQPLTAAGCGLTNGL